MAGCRPCDLTLCSSAGCCSAPRFAAPGLARGQPAYPGARSVSLVIPYAAGGIADVFGNAIIQGLADRLGGTFVLDHKPGASTTLGTRLVARARPDGATLVFAGNGTFSITPSCCATRATTRPGISPGSA